ncbi:MAG: M3 family oligoendopeptidase [Rhodospirillales bacterium]|jgi:oligoendopeptidase F|nr:M3 family oligoendopeptidase [Rhodospirillales bacterium]MBT5076245.1 M3 family oligoendopeptidase [Rhodospirillales bacterium]MBT5113745.1 M3 family oligoendopeptidase [Rhodospirillales bacterium]MBT5672273.1 M3 family oligoendopeptidase [Rhodospirillales bacterium]MBT6187044.1 M3 family oligoendopeptidase [Rhodospirillales bacterium]
MAKQAKTAKRSGGIGTLPRWNLDDLYSGPGSKVMARDLARAEKLAVAFEKVNKGRIKSLSGAKLGASVAEFEALDEILSKIMSYAQLLYACSVTDASIGQFFQTTSERVNAIATRLLFFTLEINRLPNQAIKQKLKSPALKHYASWLRDVRAWRAHELSDDMEKLLHEKSPSGRAAWVRLFDETQASLRFPIGNKKLTEAEALDLLSSPKAPVRKRAAQVVGKVMGENARTFALITNTLAKDKEVEDRWRGFKEPQSSRNLSNYVEDKVVDALVNSVKKAYPKLSHRYYRMKAGWMGKKRLDYWDRNAPLPKSADKTIPWTRARDMVLSAYGDFSPEMASVAKGFFDKRWIDAGVRAGKESGAFSHPTVPSVHPYILMNYQGKSRDVMTLAHELGHGVHQVLAGPQGHLMSDTPLTLAETASVFGEMLTFRKMLAEETNGAVRRTLIAGKVEDMLNTVVRQIAFYDFERRVHGARRDGELTADALSDIWLAVQRESLGPALKLDGDYRWYWAYIPHFIHSPFYVYAYAFGDCLVNSLYATFEAKPDGFREKYLTMLRSGGTLRHGELLKPFGLNAANPAFWGRGLEMVSGLIDELED